MGINLSTKKRHEKFIFLQYKPKLCNITQQYNPTLNNIVTLITIWYNMYYNIVHIITIHYNTYYNTVQYYIYCTKLFILSYIVQYCTSYCIPGSSPSNSHSAPPGSYSDRSPSYRPSSTLRQRSRSVNDLEDTSLSRPRRPFPPAPWPGLGPARRGAGLRCGGGPGRRHGVRFRVRVQIVRRRGRSPGPAAAVDVKATQWLGAMIMMVLTFPLCCSIWTRARWPV